MSHNRSQGMNLFKKDIKIDLLEKYSPWKLMLFSLLGALFIIYQNITFFSFERDYLGEEKHTAQLVFFVFRYLFYSALIWVLIRQNLKIKAPELGKRLLLSFAITATGYVVYVVFSKLLNPKDEWFSGLPLFQFFIMFLFCTLIGHVSVLYSEQRKKEQEIERLKVENLQSRFDALTNQINPHFFFNSLNGLTSLIRKKNDENTLAYVNKLSDVFRYILRSDKKVLVALGEELEFVQSFRYMMEVRFANKLVFDIDVGKEKLDLKIPVLSLLPLIENVVMHNIIDSDHKMEVSIHLNEASELVVSSPLFPKLIPAETNGTGLRNLESRFLLLMNKKIRIVDNGRKFTVYLPLKQE